MSNKYVEFWVKTEIVWKIYADLCVTYSDSELNEKWCEMEQDASNSITNHFSSNEGLKNKFHKTHVAHTRIRTRNMFSLQFYRTLYLSASSQIHALYFII